MILSNTIFSDNENTESVLNSNHNFNSPNFVFQNFQAGKIIQWIGSEILVVISVE